MEAEVVATHEMYRGQAIQGRILAVGARILRISVHDELRVNGYRNRVGADKWKPMIMMFCDLYGLRCGKPEHSKLTETDEELYQPLTETTGKLEEEGKEAAAHHP